MHCRRYRHQQMASEPKEQRHDQETLTNPFEDSVWDKFGAGAMNKKERAGLSIHGLLSPELLHKMNAYWRAA
jgi:hypothetical protein